MELKMMELAARMQRMRDMLGISQQDMAKKTGVSLEQYRAYEDGKEDFPCSFLYQCSQVLRVDLPELLSGERIRQARENRGQTVRRRNTKDPARLGHNMTLTADGAV